jgi:hypothetical protein
MIMVFLPTRKVIALDALPTGEKFNQEYFVQNPIPSLLHEKKRFLRQKTAINSAVPMDSSMCHNGHRVVDESCRLKIFRDPIHPTRQTSIPATFGCLEISKEN